MAANDKKEGKEEVYEVLTKHIQKATIWISAIIGIAGFIGNYYVNDYKNKESYAKIEKLDDRVSKVEKVNYELLVEQLKQIESANKKLDDKLTDTNKRIDEILNIILNHK